LQNRSIQGLNFHGNKSLPSAGKIACKSHKLFPFSTKVVNKKLNFLLSFPDKRLTHKSSKTHKKRTFFVFSLSSCTTAAASAERFCANSNGR